MSDPAQLTEQIAAFCTQIPKSVRIIAVTKQVSIEAMRAAYQAGLRDFGENRVQEAETKQAQLQDLSDITWHLIGHLQSNKVQRAIELFDWIQSVDSLKLAQRLDRLASESGYTPQLCLQVKILPDPNKFGWSVPELLADLPQLDRLEHLQIRGLMVIPPLGLNPEQILNMFHQAQELLQKIQQQPWVRIRMDQLSMGMSDDYPLAIAAGATMIRPGRVLFGERERNELA
jgi:hypothetical protein